MPSPARISVATLAMSSSSLGVAGRPLRGRVERLEVAAAEGTGQGPDAGDRIGEELLRVVLEAPRVRILDAHLGSGRIRRSAGAAVHVLGLFDQDDVLAGIGERVRGGLAALPKPTIRTSAVRAVVVAMP